MKIIETIEWECCTLSDLKQYKGTTASADDWVIKKKRGDK